MEFVIECPKCKIEMEYQKAVSASSLQTQKTTCQDHNFGAHGAVIVSVYKCPQCGFIKPEDEHSDGWFKLLGLVGEFNAAYTKMASNWFEKAAVLYKKQKGAIAQEQKQTLDTVKQQADTAKRLETVIGRIEDVQGVKAPKRPPFPSWACLTYLLWHWPMYAFARMWLSKYFRRFCFLITFFVIILQFCLIFLLTVDNKTLHLDRAKYVTVRIWSYVVGDTAAVNRFNRVDLLYDDVEFNKEQIEGLNDYIRTKHEQNLKRRK